MKEIFETILKFLEFGTAVSNPENYDIKKEKRHLYQIEAGMNYVFVSEKSGEFKDISDDRQKKLLEHYRKRLFDAA